MRTRLRSDERGASAIEFALVVPLLLVLVFGIVDFGHAYFRKISLNAAVREGARELALDQPGAVASAQAVFDPSGSETFAVVSTTTCPSGGGGGEASITAAFQHDFVAIGSLVPPIPNSINLTSTGVMRCGG